MEAYLDKCNWRWKCHKLDKSTRWDLWGNRDKDKEKGAGSIHESRDCREIRHSSLAVKKLAIFSFIFSTAVVFKQLLNLKNSEEERYIRSTYRILR